jgi:hypothetical protein
MAWGGVGGYRTFFVFFVLKVWRSEKGDKNSALDPPLVKVSGVKF